MPDSAAKLKVFSHFGYDILNIDGGYFIERYLQLNPVLYELLNPVLLWLRPSCIIVRLRAINTSFPANFIELR